MCPGDEIFKGIFTQRRVCVYLRSRGVAAFFVKRLSASQTQFGEILKERRRTRCTRISKCFERRSQVDIC